MLQLSNKTPFITNLAIFPDKQGIDTVVTVIKATFDILPDKIRVSENQLPIIKSDEYWGDPGNSSLKYASEITLPKPATDIVMIGHAYSPKGKAVKSIDVSLKVGRYKKVIRVFGDRYWKRLFGIYSISDPKPFVKMPLMYENAFGGFDVRSPDKRRKIDYEPSNPIGCGFKSKRGIKKIVGLKLPNLQHPENPIHSWKDRPAPTGFGYIAPSWEPRKKLAGTYDEAWLENRAPYLPENFDSRFLNCAHTDLITREYLHGGEDVSITNASPNGVIKYHLPKIRFEIICFIDGKKITLQPNLDTLIIEPDDDQYSMIWRTCKSCDKKVLKIQNVDVHCIESDIDLGVSNAS